MIKATTGGGATDRFYVMALKDVTKDETKTFTWYKNGYDKLNNHSEKVGNVNDFGKGKDNTRYWMKDEHSSEYGGLTDGDIWKVIEGKLNSNGLEWFVPSKSEWSAFGYMCYTKMGMTTDNYGDFGLNSSYWSSSMRSERGAYIVSFYGGELDNGSVVDTRAVRLSTTF